MQHIDKLHTRISGLEIKIDRLKSDIAALENSQAAAPWIPDLDSEYWFIDASGFTRTTENNLSNIDPLEFRLAQNNVFQTKEQALQARHDLAIRHKVRATIADLNDGWSPNWKSKEHKYFILYNVKENKFEVSYRSNLHFYPNWYYLKSSENAEKLIEMYSTADLKIALLGDY